VVESVIARTGRLSESTPRAEQRTTTKGGIAFLVHGVGCRFEDAAGVEIDLDILPDGRPIFDYWRVRAWARSAGRDVPAQAEVVAEAFGLVRLGALQPDGDGWWTWVRADALW
jgi:hypothetical protein